MMDGWRFEEDIVEPMQEQPQESYPAWAGRNVAGGLASAASGFGGVPGQVERLVESIAIPRPDHNRQPQFYPEQQQPELAQYIQQAQKERQQGSPEPSMEPVLPGAEQIKETLGKALPEGYLAPRNQAEQTYQDFAEDLGALLFPLGGEAATLGKAGKAAVISGVGNLSKLATQKMDLDESGSNMVKVGTMLMTSFGMQPFLRNRAKQMYDQVKSITPETRTITSTPIKSLVQRLRKEFVQSGNVALDSKAAFEKKALEPLELLAATDKTNLRNLIDWKQDLGKTYREIAHYDDAGRFIKELRQGLNDTLKRNPEIPKEISSLLSNADDIYIGTALSDKALNFVRNLTGVQKILGGSTLGTGALLSAILYPEKTAKTLGTAAALGSVAVVGSRIKGFLTLPGVRNEYVKMIAAAGKESAPGVLKHLNNIVEDIKENEEESGGWQFES
jgi:hypothetical protein